MASQARVIVVGSVNVDLTFQVQHIPRLGETVAGGTLKRAFGGKGANQAAAAARLGATTWLVGMTGDDDAGSASRNDLQRHGVSIHATLGFSKRPTGTAGIFLDERGNNAIAVASGANQNLTADFVANALRNLDPGPAVVLANLEIPDEAVIAAVEMSRQNGWIFILNPAPARPMPSNVYSDAFAITPNYEELDTIGSARSLLDAGVNNAIVTLGKDGADLHRRSVGPTHFPTFPIQVVDTTGAGDAFNGALAWSLASGRPVEESMRLATGAGALPCRGLGARSSLPTSNELTRLVGDEATEETTS